MSWTAAQQARILAVLLTGAGGCPSRPPVKPAASPNDLARSCPLSSKLGSVAVTLSHPEDPCRAWVAALAGRIVFAPAGSGVVWASKTLAGPALVIGAAHTRGEGFFGPAGRDVPERLGPGATTFSFVQMTDAPRGEPQAQSHGVAILYSPPIPSIESGNHLRDILPRHDFYLAAVDDQVLEGSRGQVAAPLRMRGPHLDDPLALSTTTDYRDALPGQLAVAIGYPHHGLRAGEGLLAFSVGRVLGDAEAKAAISALAAARDGEGAVPYASEVEVIVAGRAVEGMSGGGLFDRDGTFLGVLVRASSAPIDGQFFVRAVRASFIARTVGAAVAAAPDAVRTRLSPFLGKLASRVR